MTLDALRQSVSDVIGGNSCSSELYFLLSSHGATAIKRADIDQGALDELTRNFIESVRTVVHANEDLSLLDISEADNRANAIYRYDLPKVPPQLQQLEVILQRDNFDTFNFEKDDLSQLDGILLVLGHGTNQLALYKHQYPVSLLKRDVFSLIRIRNQNRLIKVDEDILRINPKFEFMRVGDSYFIVDIKTLEKFFGFHEAIRNVAVQGIARIESADLLVDTAVLTERLDDIAFSRKLVRAAKSSPVLGTVPRARVVNFVSTHPILKGKFRLSEDGSKLKLDTKVSQDLFLKLLSDDFLKSELTKRYYASLAKDNLDAPVAYS